jgi:hypothetical protein
MTNRGECGKIKQTLSDPRSTILKSKPLPPVSLAFVLVCNYTKIESEIAEMKASAGEASIGPDF